MKIDFDKKVLFILQCLSMNLQEMDCLSLFVHGILSFKKLTRKCCMRRLEAASVLLTWYHPRVRSPFP